VTPPPDRREALGVVLFYLAATTALTWPLVAHPFARLAAPIGPGDPYLNTWILGWDLRTISREPFALLTGRIFDANIFFPAAGTLTYSDHLILQALLLWPILAITRDLTFCYNALLFLSLFASSLSMYVFARSVTGSRTGALAAGLAWGFFPFRFAHLLHLQLQSLYFLPLAFLFLHRLVAGRKRRDAVWLGVTAGLQAISSVYWAMAGALALTVGAAALAVAVGRWRSGPLLRRLVLAAIVGALLAAPFVWPYWVVQQREGFSRNLYEASQHEAVAASYLRVPPDNLLYGRTGWLRPAEAPAKTRHEGPEQELFPGFVLAGLAVFGFARAWRRDARPLALAMAAVAVTGFVISLGPDGARSVYAGLHRAVFGFQAIRAPARFGVLVAFAIATLAAVGIREALASVAPGRGALALAACLVAAATVELVNVPIPTVPAPPTSSPVAQWLRAAQGAGAVLYLPLDADLGNTPAMLDSLVHGRRIVNGYSGQRPPFFMGLVDTLSRLPSAEALWTLRDLGVRFVVGRAGLKPSSTGANPGSTGEKPWSTGEQPRSTAAGPLIERARFDGAVVYELVWSPEVEAALPRPEPPPPPPPGSLPFAEHERATYRVVWLTGAALGVPAGQAVIAGTRTGQEIHMALEVESADWVKQFFEARDRFETTMDAALLPLRQEQRLREGRRRVDRTVRFDAERRTVTVGDGPALPLPRGARDGLSAFLYARTLPLAAGYEAKFPVVEGGRQLTAAIRVTGEEPVSVAGQAAVAAWRVEARFESRAERRPMTATLLLSRDARHLPLRMLIDAGFGSFRVELAEFSSR
jgi:hypothetical protein